MRVALLSNVTVDVLAGMLREGHSVWTPQGFGAWMETALDPPADLAEFSPEAIYVLLDSRFGEKRGFDRIADARSALASAFPKAAVVIPDVASLLADLGDAAYDERMWTLAKMPWSIDALIELRKLVAPVKKVLALDLDNTLWKGVVSEDGVGGIVPDVTLQREALSLKEKGVLLVALSRNDAEDVKGVWDDRRMVIREDDFAAMRIDWNGKPANLDDVARELNLGVDSFVFVDDDPANRAEMRAVLPEVAVAPFPSDLSIYFPFAGTTAEDAARTQMYKDEAKRREAASGLSYHDYLCSLAICNDIHAMTEDEIPRVAQLAQKTNQFNVCANRWTEEEVRAFASDPSRATFTLHSSDRFGDLGLVAFVHVRMEGDMAEIVDWVMSCRAMNRRIEFAFEAEVEKALIKKGVKEISATWKATGRNEVVSNVFLEMGFALIEKTPYFRRYMKKF